MPQRASFLNSTGPFGNTLFSSNWASNRERATTLTSIRSSEDPSSPTQSSFSKDGLADADVKTLDYLGLAETPQQTRAILATPERQALMQQQQFPSILPQLLASVDSKTANRFRSYSVNATQKYATDEDDEGYGTYSGHQSGAMTPSAIASHQMAQLQRQIRQHNEDVQRFAKQASGARPRARTAGILDAPPQRSSVRTFMAQPSRLDSSVNASDLTLSESVEQDNLADSVRLMQIGSESQGYLLGGVEDLEAQVTRALWIGSIPVSTTVSTLNNIFGAFGPIESTRVLTHKNCGFVNFETTEGAVQARQLLNGKEIFPGAGAVRIGFAKAPNSSTNGTPAINGLHPSTTPDPFAGAPATSSDGRFNGDGSPISGTTCATNALPVMAPALSDMQSEILDIVREYGATTEDLVAISRSIETAVAYQDFQFDIPPTPEPGHTRIYDAPRLRDIRKRIDNGACSLQEIEETATGMLPEIAELASDYLGNTVVQKLFEYCSEMIKEQMLARIVPHLAEIGVHKNGTWAAQKIIDVCRTVPQINMIIDSLRPYTIPLFLDQYGNYVLQCCLRFGAPYNDFIFESMLSQMWPIAQGRFGARAIRACLESHHSTKNQQRILASAISLNGVQLATNPNGALLLTWLLDTCTFPQRRTVLAPRLIPHLVQLCTHKVAYLTVLKVINQRNESEARDMISKALFFSPNDQVLEQILSDQSSGATLIFKILTTPFFDENMRNEVSKNVARVLTRIKAQPNQGYKRLMDEVGLSSRPSHSHPGNVERRPISQQNNTQLMHQQAYERQYSGSYLPTLGSFDPNNSMARTPSSDSSNFAPYAMNSMASASYTQTPAQHMAHQQPQYQAFGAAPQRNYNNYMQPNVPTGFAGFATPPASADGYRGMSMHASPLAGSSPMSPMMGQNTFQQQQYNVPIGSNMNLYGYQQQNFYAQHMQPIQNGARRGRVSPPNLP